jgi:hypothetical protein
LGIVGYGQFKEADGARTAFIGIEVGEADSGVIIYADVEVFPSLASYSAAPVSGDPMAKVAYLTQLLDIQVQEFAWVLTLVPYDGHCRLKALEAV